MRWQEFFPAEAEVIALPSWQAPRLYLPAETPRARWQGSGFYPAFRPLARVRRFLLRVGVAAGLGGRKRADSAWPVGEFAAEVFPQVEAAAVLVGTTGPAQRVTVQLLDGRLRVLGYLAYAEKEAARRRLRQERTMLEAIPRPAGPALLKHGPLGDGEALLVAALPGRSPPPARPTPPTGAIRLLESLVLPRAYPLADHPWVRGAAPPGDLLEPLAGRSWPVVIQHGDFAPWNLLQREDGSVRAIDWEYGTLEGFPFLDIAYLMLQVAALLCRWSPARARSYTATRLAQVQLAELEPLSHREACSIARLAAYDAYCRSAEDGHLPDEPLQRWRWQVWAEGT